jgi:AcrR family transcriptional regulator
MLGEAVKIDPRVKRTRQILLHALQELVQEKSLDHITVQDIAARAEVNRATFYAHFEDKNAILNAMVRDHFQAKLDERLPGKPALTTDNLRLLIATTCEYLGEFINHCSPVPRFGEHAIMFIVVQNHIYETLLLWIRASGGAAPEAIAQTSGWAIWGTVFQWAREGRKVPAARLTEQIMMMLQGGLRDYLRDERHEART